MESLPEPVLDKILMDLSLKQLFQLKNPGKNAVHSSFIFSSKRCLKIKEKLVIKTRKKRRRSNGDQDNEQNLLDNDFFYNNFKDVISSMTGLKEVTGVPRHSEILAFLLKTCKNIDSLEAKLQGNSDFDFLQNQSLKMKNLNLWFLNNHSSLTSILSACPSLENLSLNVLSYDFPSIDLPKGLRTLTIQDVSHWTHQEYQIHVFSSPAIQTLEEITVNHVELYPFQVKPAPKLRKLTSNKPIDSRILTSLAMFSPFLTDLEMKMPEDGTPFSMEIRTLIRAKFTSITREELKEVIDKNPRIEELSFSFRGTKRKEVLTHELIRLRNLVKLDLSSNDKYYQFSFESILFFLENRASKEKPIEMVVDINLYSDTEYRTPLLNEISRQKDLGSKIVCRIGDLDPERDFYDYYKYLGL